MMDYLCIYNLFTSRNKLLGGGAMKLKKIMQKDRSGISTILVIAVVVILVVAVAAVYLVLSGDDDKEEKEIEKEILAPGTKLTYDITLSGATSEIEAEYLGQSADLYFIEFREKLTATTWALEYSTLTKKVPEGAKASKADIETIHGKKKLDLWEQTTSVSGITTSYKIYVDASIGLVYKQEETALGMTAVMELKAYTPIWQKPSEVAESGSIGMVYKYTFPISEETSFSAEIVCIADCVKNQFGVMYDLTDFENLKLYYLSNNPQGLPVDAVDSKRTQTISTLDGNKTVQIWEYVDAAGSGISFYYDQASKIIYRLVFTSTVLSPVIFDLTDKPGA
jgi:hypothetical protein